jgi:hypothetical protein
MSNVTDQKLSSEQALGPGCGVWFTAPLELSAWARQIDWYLNHQIMKAGLHARAEVSKELLVIAKATEAEIPSIKPDVGAPLMIACSSLLPTQTTVVVPLAKDDVASWATKCHEIWLSLKRPKFRVFLPDSVSSASFTSAWPEKAAMDLVEVIGPLNS